MNDLFIEGSPQTIQNMADLRDTRRLEQAKLFQSEPGGQLSRTLVMFSLVVPGPIKNNRFLELVFNCGYQAFSAALKTEHIRISSYREDCRPAGATAYWMLDANAVRIKQLSTVLERTEPLGVLWDFDVFSGFEQKLSAAELGFPPRSCLICGNAAKLCARNRTHSVSDLQRTISSLIRQRIPLPEQLSENRYD